MSNLSKIIIAIDGYSSTGKSTIAKQLAKVLGYVYVDTGAMYRAVTLYALQHDLISKDEFLKEKLIESLPDIQLQFHFNAEKGFAEIYLNGKNVEEKIRTLEVSNYVSQVAAVPEVRKKQVEQQHKFGKEKGIVMDGRDIGTVVFPEAELKLFMTASAETRAQRRYDELLQKGEKVTFEEVLENVKSRDHIDSTRKDSPLLQAPDAVVIDNSEMSLNEQFEKILALAKNAIENA
ncbi:(d)CMP kinase [Mesonia mobilis]|uniref:Cytidylate kinase n=1 Tax=Mesonia mobilis TaxID=369791 RepID=A0ABQ3BRW8_9FLAO|nr:(d)CMP kinase [Mesonia mobilis]MBQ0737862.1 (d)CMP kinase [Aquimarina celericrescens]GGZ52437.1 cytidylate kinase [Mesonia mobilis]